MPDMIRNGANGGAYYAKVDSTNHLHTASNTKSRMAMQAETASKAYTIYGKSNFVASSQDLLYFQYTGDNYFFIDKIIISAAAQTTTSKDDFKAKAEIYRNPTLTTAGTSPVTPLNTDFSSSLTLSATCYHGGNSDLVMGYDATTEMVDVRLGHGTEEMHFDGSIILGKSDSLGIIGSVTVAEDRMRVMILGYEGTRE